MGPVYNQDPTLSGRKMSIADYEAAHTKGRDTMNNTATELRPGLTQSSAYIKEQIGHDSVFNKTLTS